MLTPFGDLPDGWVAHAGMSEQADYLRARLSRRGFLKGVALAGLGAASPALWVRSAIATGSPRALRHVAFGSDPKRQATVSFATGASFRQAVVEYGVDDTFGASAAADIRTVAGVTTLYGHAGLDGLTPGTTYRYRVRLDGTVGDTATLTTAPEQAGPFTFTAFGDQGVSPTARAVVRQLLKVRPRFHLLAGDMCYADATGSGRPSDRFDVGVWDTWLAMIEPVAASTAWMCATGNHDMEPGYGQQGYDGYLNRFVLPQTGPAGCPTVYSFRYGNVGFVCLDANEVSYEIPHNLGYSAGAQTAWLDNELAAMRAPGSGVDFVVVFFHHCAYSTSTVHGSDGGVRGSWVPVFDRHEVDLVVNGHAHLYERTHQLRGGQVTKFVERSQHVQASQGTTYITAGGGGEVTTGGFAAAGSYVVRRGGGREPEQAPWSVATKTSTHCFLAIDSTPKPSATVAARLAIRVIDKDGNLVDDLTLLRGGADRPAGSSLEQSASLLAGGAAAAVVAGTAGTALWRRRDRDPTPPPAAPQPPD